MDILLDTNFVITCVKQKIDFDSQIDEVTDEKVEWIVPEDVLAEIESLSKRKGLKIRDKKAAEISLDLISLINPKKIRLAGNNPNVDIKIVNYLKKNNAVVLATLDKNLKNRVRNKILTIRGKKHLDIV